MRNPTAMSRKHLQIDPRVLVLGTIVSLLVLGFVSMITFVPGSRTWLVAFQFGLLPQILFLGPMVVTRSIDRRSFPDAARSYLIVNGILALLFAVFCGLAVYSMLPAGQKKMPHATSAALR
jgi:hypothetical protein